VRSARYSALITEAVDEGLSKLGQSPKNAIYEALETNFSMRRKDIPTRFAEFSSILLDNIGPGTRPVLQYIVDRFSCGVHDESLSCIELGESIKRVDTILKAGQLARTTTPTNQTKKTTNDGSNYGDRTKDHAHTKLELNLRRPHH
jgi:hypothetical protein